MIIAIEPIVTSMYCFLSSRMVSTIDQGRWHPSSLDSNRIANTVRCTVDLRIPHHLVRVQALFSC